MRTLVIFYLTHTKWRQDTVARGQSGSDKKGWRGDSLDLWYENIFTGGVALSHPSANQDIYFILVKKNSNKMAVRIARGQSGSDKHVGGGNHCQSEA